MITKLSIWTFVLAFIFVGPSVRADIVVIGSITSGSGGDPSADYQLASDINQSYSIPGALAAVSVLMEREANFRSALNFTSLDFKCKTPECAKQREDLIVEKLNQIERNYTNWVNSKPYPPPPLAVFHLWIPAEKALSREYDAQLKAIDDAWLANQYKIYAQELLAKPAFETTDIVVVAKPATTTVGSSGATQSTTTATANPEIVVTGNRCVDGSPEIQAAQRQIANLHPDYIYVGDWHGGYGDNYGDIADALGLKKPGTCFAMELPPDYASEFFGWKDMSSVMTGTGPDDYDLKPYQALFSHVVASGAKLSFIDVGLQAAEAYSKANSVPFTSTAATNIRDEAMANELKNGKAGGCEHTIVLNGVKHLVDGRPGRVTLPSRTGSFVIVDLSQSSMIGCTK